MSLKLQRALDLLQEMPGIRPLDTTQEWMEAVLKSLHEGPSSGDPSVQVAVNLIQGEPWMSKFRRYLNLNGAPEIVKLIAALNELATLQIESYNGKNHANQWVLPLLEGMTDPGSQWVKKQLRDYLIS